MKIVEYGLITPQYASCSHCEAFLEYTPNDIKEKHLGSRDYTYIICPICGKTVVLKEKGEF